MKVVVAALVCLLAAGCVSRTSPPTASDSPADETLVEELPAAADGTNLAACADGDCEVEISGQVELTVGRTPVRVIVDDESLMLSYTYESGTTGATSLNEPGTGGGWTDAVTGQNTEVTLVGIEAITAVLKFETA